MKTDKTKEKIREICTYHSDGGTSGYCLSDKQFTRIFAVLDEALEAQQGISLDEMALEIEQNKLGWIYKGEAKAKKEI